MASGTIETYGYKSGDSKALFIRSIGRVVNAGNGIFAYIYADKPIFSTSSSVSITNIVVYRLNANDVVSAVTTNPISSYAIKGNCISLVVPINTTTSAGSTYYLEGDVTVSFS